MSLIKKIDGTPLGPTIWIYDAVPSAGQLASEGVQTGDWVFDGRLYTITSNHSLLQVAGSSGPGSAQYVDGTNGNNSNSGLSWNEAKATITSAITAAAAGDTIHVAPGSYDETVTVNKAKLTIVGHGGRGAVFIEPSAAGAEGMQVTAPDVTLINIGVDGDDTADYALNVHGNIGVHADGVRRFRAYACKFELGSGAGPAVLLDGDNDDAVGDILFSDCEFAWAGYGIKFLESGYGAPTQVFLEGGKMHNIATSYLWDGDSSVGPTNLEVSEVKFDASEGGTEPTKHLDLVVGDGIFSGNRFAILTNDNTKLVISANIQWVANGTEAGWSTARPA